jgi:hypothetical protein
MAYLAPGFGKSDRLLVESMNPDDAEQEQTQPNPEQAPWRITAIVRPLCAFRRLHDDLSRR